MEQAEGVDIIETVVADPVSELAVVTQFSSMSGLGFVFQVAVGTFPLQLLGSSSLHPPAEPADDNKRPLSKSHTQHVPTVYTATNLISTYGPVNSNTLLMVCLRTIIIAIWMNRSVRHPLG